MAVQRSSSPWQASFDDLGTLLSAVTFVVVDLETTGGSPSESRITEFGAVKIRGGEVLGEFQTLVDPQSPIPASISALTGITGALVAGRPPVEAVLPTFLEFCRGAALVAHNARFDVGFLDANLTRLAYPRLGAPVVCTAALARRLVREEVHDCRLATLATYFRCRTTPIHRALEDARATVEVFHGLLERAGPFGVLTLEDLVDFAQVRNAPLYRSRRGLAEGLPRKPGVYAFRSASGEILYVGKATDLRARVRSYFGNDDRRRVVDLLKETASVDTTVCPTPLEAGVREARLLRQHRPRFNRRGTTTDRAVYVKLTVERFPRLSVVREPRPDGATYLGPVGSRRAALQIADALYEVAPIRRCSPRLGPRTGITPCALAEMGRCLSPCDGTVDAEGYAQAVRLIADAMNGDAGHAVGLLERRMAALAQAGAYERAAEARERLRSLTFAAERTRRLRTLARTEELLASRPARRDGHLDVALIRWGRLIATATCPAEDADQTSRDLLNEAGFDDGGAAPGQHAAPVGREAAAELDLISRWLEGSGARSLSCTGTLASTVAGGRVLAVQGKRLARAHRRTGEPASELDAKRVRREPPARSVEGLSRRQPA